MWIGNFELEVPGNAKLKVTYIGYTTREVATDGRISFVYLFARR